LLTNGQADKLPFAQLANGKRIEEIAWARFPFETAAYIYIYTDIDMYINMDVYIHKFLY
jgi:hypothetical protein